MATLPPNGIHPGGRRARAVRRVAERLGFHAVPRHFYSVVPDLDELDDTVWERESDVPGVDFHPTDQLELLESQLATYIPEFSWEDNGIEPPFDPQNDSYRTVDVEVLYAMVRHAKPSRVLELGSGYTTVVSSRAARANARDGRATRVTAVDPFPKDILLDLKRHDPSVEVRPMRGQDLPISEFTGLGREDILFIDTSHTVKVGGEVNFFVLEVLPRLAPGVIVHFHDIFIPFEYPRSWMSRHSYYFNEQYLLQAFLAQNERFEVLMANYCLSRRHPGRLAATIPSFTAGAQPSGFWLRRRD